MRSYLTPGHKQWIEQRFRHSPGVKGTELYAEMVQGFGSNEVKLPGLRTIQNYLKKLRKKTGVFSDPTVELESGAEPMIITPGDDFTHQDEKEEPIVSNPTVDIIKNAVQDPEVMNALAPVFQGIVEQIVDAKLNNLIEQAQTQAEQQVATAETAVHNNGNTHPSAVSPNPPQAMANQESQPSQEAPGKYDALLNALVPMLVQKMAPSQANPWEMIGQVMPQITSAITAVGQFSMAPFIAGMEVSNNMFTQSLKAGGEPSNIAQGAKGAVESIRSGVMYGGVQNTNEQKPG